MKQFEVSIMINDLLKDIYPIRAESEEEAVHRAWNFKAKKLRINPEDSLYKKRGRWVVKQASIPKNLKPISIELKVKEKASIRDIIKLQKMIIGKSRGNVIIKG